MGDILFLTCPVGGVFGKGNIYTTAHIVGFHRPNDNWGGQSVHLLEVCLGGEIFIQL